MSEEAVDILQLLRELTTDQESTVSALQPGSATECPVCLEQYRQPKVLPCGHTLCRQCLENIFQSEGRIIICPLDRQRCTLAERGIDGLPTNFAVNDMIDQGLASDNAGSLRSSRCCTECNSLANLQLCQHCDGHLCRNCIDLHITECKIKLHRLSQQIRKYKTQHDTSKDKRHDILKEQTLCFDGVREKVLNFAKCFLSTVEQIVKDYERGKLAETYDHQRCFEEKLSNHLEVPQQNVVEAQSNLDKLCQDMHTVVSGRQLGALERGITELLHKHECTSPPKPTKWDFITPSDEEQERVYSQVRQLLKGAIITGDREVETDRAERTYYTTAAASQESRSPTPATGERGGGFDIPDSLESSTTGSSHPTQRAFSYDTSEVGAPRPVLVRDMGHDEQFHCMEGISVSQSNRIVSAADGGNDPIQSLSPDESNRGRTQPPQGAALDDTSAATVSWSVLGKGEGTGNGQFDGLEGIAVSPSHRIICVADSANDRIQLFSYDGSHIRTVRKNYDVPTGVACTLDDHFVICNGGLNKFHAQVINCNGVLLKTIGSPESNTTDIRGVAVDSTGDIYVTLSNHHRVQIVKPNGDIKAFGRKGSADGQFNCPLGVAVTAQGQVIVADSDNHRLQVFTTDGRHTLTIRHHRVKDPFGVAVNQQGDKVYVCCDEGVAVYQLRPTVRLLKVIPPPVAGDRPRWIAWLSENDALVTLTESHQVHHIQVM